MAVLLDVMSDLPVFWRAFGVFFLAGNPLDSFDLTYFVLYLVCLEAPHYELSHNGHRN